MKKIISLICVLLTGAAVLAVANGSTIVNNATNTAVGNISGIQMN
jgi:hypothetical protein